MTQLYLCDDLDDESHPSDGLVRGNFRMLQSLFQRRHQVPQPFRVGVSFLAKETLRAIRLGDSFVVSVDREPLAMSLVPLSYSEGFHLGFDAYIMVYHPGSEEVIHKLVALGKLVVVIVRAGHDLPVCKPLPDLIAQRDNCHVTTGCEHKFESDMTRLSRRLRDRRRWGTHAFAAATVY